MIPRDYITEWRARAPWVEDIQVEQDLIISRALVEIFSDPNLRESLAFRGGTALYKLHIDPPARYSEDIDLVQIRAEPIGPTLDALRAALDPWLGKPQWKQNEGRVTLSYRFDMAQEGGNITRALFERNLAAKLKMPLFAADIGPLLAIGYRWDIHEAVEDVSSQLIECLPGDPWKGE